MRSFLAPHRFLRRAFCGRLLTASLLTVLGWMPNAAQAVPIIIDDFTKVELLDPLDINSPSKYWDMPNTDPNVLAKDELNGLDLTRWLNVAGDGVQISNVSPPPGPPALVSEPFVETWGAPDPDHILGLSRTTKLTATKNSTNVGRKAAVDIIPKVDGVPETPQLSYAGDFEVNPIVELSYDGILPITDLNDQTAARVKFIYYDATGGTDTAVPLTIGFYVSDGVNDGYVERQLVDDIPDYLSAITVDLKLIDALPGDSFSDVDFSDLVDLKFTFSFKGVEGNYKDFTIQLLDFVAEAETVPEPSTWALGLIGLVSLTSYGWFHQRNRKLR